MKKLVASVGLLVVVPILASAQDIDHQYHGQGYFYLAGAPSSVTGPGSSSNSFQVGGGGEWLSGHGLGLGGELLRSTQSWLGHDASLDTWIGSINVSYHFGPSREKRRVEPFVTGGYSLYDLPNIAHENGGNIGAGLNVWLVRRAALRLEIRDDIGGQGLSAEYVSGPPSYLRSSQHLVGFRIGVTFR